MVKPTSARKIRRLLGASLWSVWPATRIFRGGTFRAWQVVGYSHSTDFGYIEQSDIHIRIAAPTRKEAYDLFYGAAKQVKWT